MADKLMNLLIKYGSVGNVPKEEIEPLGFTVVETVLDGTKSYSLVKMEYANKKAPEKEAVFGELELKVETEKELRVPDGERLVTLSKLEFKLSNALKEDVYELDFYSSDLTSFVGNFRAYLEERLGTQAVDTVMKDYSFLNYRGFTPLRDVDKLKETEAFKGAFNGGLGPDELEDIDLYLGRLKSFVDDSEELKKAFEKDFDRITSLREELEYSKSEAQAYGYVSIGDDGTNLEDFFSGADMFGQLIVDYFRHKGYETIAAGLEDCKTTSNRLDYLESLKIDSLSSYERKTTLEKEIKEAGKNKKRELAGELKKAKKDLKQERKLLGGAIEFFAPYRSYAASCSSLINRIQKLISVSVESGFRTFYLNGEPNARYDKNPGSVSGDCTEESPLPFYDARVHNVKVFNDEEKHIGNVYLLQSTEKGGKKRKVWHLDAVQIPSKINGTNFASSLVDALTGEAKKSDVDLITINDEEKHISNYDYISAGLVKYNEVHKLGTTTITKPKVVLREGYSKFQGSDAARVLYSA